MPPPENLSEAAKILSTISYFAGLDALTLETVVSTATPQTYDTGQIVFLEGEICAGLYVIETGWLKAVKSSPAGREQVLRFLGPGESFPEIALLMDASNPATVITLEPVKLWLVRREILLDLVEMHPHLARIIIQNLAGRLRYLLNLVEDLSLRPVEARLARLLLEQSRGDEIIQRRRWATQAEMAARLGTVPDVLHRTLRSLVEAGVIEVERQQIKILDRAALEARAMLDE